MSEFEFKIYAIRSKDGKWFKSRGQSGHGERWVENINSAKLYSTAGPAKGVISWWSKNYPQYGIPDLVEIVSKEFSIIDQVDRVKESRRKELIKIEKNKEIEKLQEIEKAKKELENAQKRIKELQGH